MAVDEALLSDEPLQGHGQPRRHAVACDAGGQYRLLIGLGLIAEKTFARDADDAGLDALLSQQAGTFDERRHLRTRSDHHYVGLRRVGDDVGALGELCGLLAAACGQRGQVLDVLTREDERHGAFLFESETPC